MSALSGKIGFDICPEAVLHQRGNSKDKEALMTTDLELLEYLSLRAGCMYMSDLRRPELFESICRAIDDISPDFYSLREWNDTVSYITGTKDSFESSEKAADYLRNFCMRYR